MGYYIQGPNKGKAQFLVEQYGAKFLSALDIPYEYSSIPGDKAVIVVIDNGSFEAAALCYSNGEFEELVNFDIVDDPRPRKILMMDKELAYKLAGFKS